jgi:hypothetical protein
MKCSLSIPPVKEANTPPSCIHNIAERFFYPIDKLYYSGKRNILKKFTDYSTFFSENFEPEFDVRTSVSGCNYSIHFVAHDIKCST